jgi:hypothetical protein
MSTLTITDTSMVSDTTPHTAELVKLPSPLTGYSWQVTWLPGRHLHRNEAISAMTLAEMLTERAHILADPASRLWWHIDGYAEELGLSRAEAVAMASASPEDIQDGPTGADQ